jgi:hypothetical protein
MAIFWLTIIGLVLFLEVGCPVIALLLAKMIKGDGHG